MINFVISTETPCACSMPGWTDAQAGRFPPGNSKETETRPSPATGNSSTHNPVRGRSNSHRLCYLTEIMEHAHLSPISNTAAANRHHPRSISFRAKHVLHWQNQLALAMKGAGTYNPKHTAPYPPTNTRGALQSPRRLNLTSYGQCPECGGASPSRSS